MKLSTIAIARAALFGAGAVLSQGSDCTSVALQAIPACALHCFPEGARTMGCGSLDFACQCRQEAAMYAAIESCVASSCASSQFQGVIDGAATVCRCAIGATGNKGGQAVSPISGSVTPSVTPSVATGSSGAVPTTTGSGSGGGTGGSPTEPAPTYFATSSVISGGSKSGSAPVVYAFGAALALAVV